MVSRFLSQCSLALLCGPLFAEAAAAQTKPVAAQAPIQIGLSHSVQSSALQERRTVNVVVPAGYGKEPARRYPVLYLLDGGLD